MFDSFEEAFAWPILLLALGTMVVLQVLRKVVPQINTTPALRRFVVLYPFVICVPLSLIPAFPIASDTVSRILVGLWAAFFSKIVYEIIRKVVLARGIEIPKTPAAIIDKENPPREEKPEDES